MRLGCQRPTNLRLLPKDRFVRVGRRVLPCSGCHGDGKNAFEDLIFTGLVFLETDPAAWTSSRPSTGEPREGGGTTGARRCLLFG